VGQQPGRRANTRLPDAFLRAIDHAVDTVRDLGHSLAGSFGHRFPQSPDAIKACSSVRRDQPLLVRAERCGGNPAEIAAWTMELDVDTNRRSITRCYGDPST
jgi:hypothetical protein